MSFVNHEITGGEELAVFRKTKAIAINVRVVYHGFGTVLPGNPVGKSFLNQKRFDREGGGEPMKLPIVRRGSTENPVSLEEINALYQSWGSAGSTRCPCTIPLQPQGTSLPCPLQQTPQIPKIGSRFLAHSAAWHSPCRAGVTPQLGAEPCHIFLGSRGDGIQPPAPRAQECTGTACTEKFPLGCKIYP